MTRALETIKDEQEVTDETTPLIQQWVESHPDPIVPAFTNHVHILGPPDDHPTPMDKAPSELGYTICQVI